jgi:hypothetical protein
MESDMNWADDFLDFFRSYSSTDIPIIEKYAEKSWNDFKNKKQPWNVVKSSDAIEIWKEFGRSGIIMEQGILQDMIDLTIENIYKLLGNTLNIYKIQQSKSDFGYNYLNSSIRYTDGYYSLEPCLRKLKSAHTDEEKLFALDYTFNVLHSDEETNMADWFIQGGDKTLDIIRDLKQMGYKRIK